MTCNLILAYFIFDTLREHSQGDVIYTNYSIVFIWVDHNLLINTPCLFGIRNPFLSWLCSFLSNWYLHVYVFSSSSSVFTPSSRVQQGPVLSPLHFAILVNSASSILCYAKLLIFVDDMNLFLRINSISYSRLLQRDLNNLIAWESPSVSTWTLLNVLYFPFLAHTTWLVFLTLFTTFLLNH